jgi:hypothetical protein
LVIPECFRRDEARARERDKRIEKYREKEKREREQREKERLSPNHLAIIVESHSHNVPLSLLKRQTEEHVLMRTRSRIHQVHIQLLPEDPDMGTDARSVIKLQQGRILVPEPEQRGHPAETAPDHNALVAGDLGERGAVEVGRM